MPGRAAGTAPTSNGFVRWLLLPDRDSGPRAPVASSARRTVFDPHTGETFHLGDRDSEVGDRKSGNGGRHG